MNAQGLRLWVGRCQYPGCDEFYLGTVSAESEMQAQTALVKLWQRISPHPQPPRLICIPGAIRLQLEDDAA